MPKPADPDPIDAAAELELGLADAAAVDELTECPTCDAELVDGACPNGHPIQDPDDVG